MVDIRIGAMGWNYEDWRGPFYTRDLAASRMLEQYSQVFSTIEIDSSFYGAPRATTLASWSRQVPEDFIFSAKVPRSITHERRLIGAAEAALEFGTLLSDELGQKLGAILLQLPPDFGIDSRETLDRFLAGITSRRRTALPWTIEFRDSRWGETDVLETLTEHSVACATTERVDLGGPLRYVRLLGIENSVQRFDERQIDRSEDLKGWAVRLNDTHFTMKTSRPILVYVRNLFEGHAPASIQSLREYLDLPNTVPPGRQQMALF